MAGIRSSFRWWLFLFLCLSWLYAQTSTFNIIVTAPTDADSTVKPLLGVISGPDPNAEMTNVPNLTSAYQDIGVIYVRNNDYYDDRLDMERMFNCPDTSTYPSWRCDPDDPSNYDFSGSDEQFQSYLDGGFEPFFRLGGEYENAFGGHDFKGPRDFEEETNWIKAAIHVVEHYNNFNGTQNNLHILDLWTEFPGLHFWTRSDLAFIKFWVRAFDSLKTHFPQMKIGGPGFNPKATLDVMEEVPDNVAQKFLAELYDRGLKPDWIGWHMWNNDPQSYIIAAQKFRDLLNGQGAYSNVSWAGSGFFEDVEMYVDAYGTSAVVMDENGNPVDAGKAVRDSLYNKQKGAAILTGQWIAMQYTEVKIACYYRGTGLGASSPNYNPNDPQSHMGAQGLFYGDEAGTYKPTAHAFRLWSQVYKNFPKLLKVDVPVTNNEGKELWALAASDGNRFAVLIANLSPVKQSFSLSLLGKNADLNNFEKIEVYQVDDLHDGRNARLVKGPTFNIDGYTVQLLVFTPRATGVATTKNNPFPLFNAALAPGNHSGEYQLTVHLNKKSRLRFTLYNVLGQKIQVLVDRSVPSGTFQKSFALKGLPAGLYFGQLRTDFGQKSFRIVLKH